LQPATTAGAKKDTRLPFALGTSIYPAPIAGLGGPLVWSSGSVSTLTPIPKTGFLAKLRFKFTGSITFSTAGTGGAWYPWRAIQNYTLQNSLNYPYRSLLGDGIWQMMKLQTTNGLNDPITGTNYYTAVAVTGVTTAQPFYWEFEDWIGQNDGVNFSRYLLSAMTTSNDLTINMTWAPTSATPGILTAVTGSPVISAFSMSCAVSAEYLTVPNPQKYQWPRRNLVRQIVEDPSFNTPAVGLNTINLTPIQGPEFLGLGIQVLNANYSPDTLLPATTGITEIDIYVNGTIPLMQFPFADIMQRYVQMFGRNPSLGYLYIDFSNDLGLINAMSHTHRKVLSTAKYSQISVNVTLNANFTAGSNAKIVLWKHTQQKYALNQ